MRLSEHCGFMNLRDSLIRDRLILGVKNNRSRKRLLEKKDLTLDNALDILRTQELTDIRTLDMTTEEANVNRVKAKETIPRKTQTEDTTTHKHTSGDKQCKNREQSFTRLIMHNKTVAWPPGQIRLLTERKGRKWGVRYHIVKPDLTPLLCRTTCEKMNLVKILDAGVNPTHDERINVSSNVRSDPILYEFTDIFTGIGCLEGTYFIQVDEGFRPVVHPPRKVPVPLRDTLMLELDNMVNCGILAKVQLDEKSSYLTIMNTPFGRYRWLRMPFEINLAPEVWQQRTHELVGGLTGVEVIADDFLVCSFGDSNEAAIANHDQNLKAFLSRARERNLTLNSEELKFRQSQVPFIGHLFTAEGLKPDPSKVASRSYKVEINGRFYRRNRKQLRSTTEPLQETSFKMDEDDLTVPDNLQEQNQPLPASSQVETSTSPPRSQLLPTPQTTELSARPPQEATTTEIRTRHGRLIKPPKKFDIELLLKQKVFEKGKDVMICRIFRKSTFSFSSTRPFLNVDQLIFLT
ncbi:Uncharacterized protein K02A2.6 [Stylophora pistillata]|uniref:Uncharacterized protein K02A2.6 n=1 Tax=Stylophora pistillata TaxID=50429 RepID=A0A2B4RF46_STYPI|nr:Uncharacterized protein K02A2.6 [Stylophora pistillata]